MDTESIIRTLYKAWEKGIYVVGPTYLAREYRIPKSTAQKILFDLEKSGYGSYVKKKGFVLNEKGINAGKKVTRKHRLLECLLDEMGLSRDVICEEASRIDHVIGENFEKILEKKYGGRERCPCGNVIPCLS